MFWAGNTSKLLLEDTTSAQPKGSEKSSVGTGVDPTADYPETATTGTEDSRSSPSPTTDGNERPSGTTKEDSSES